jgi:hypothetical protein
VRRAKATSDGHQCLASGASAAFCPVRVCPKVNTRAYPNPTLDTSGVTVYSTTNGSSTATYATFSTPVAAIRLTMNALSSAGGKVTATILHGWHRMTPGATMQLQQAPPHGRGSATASGNHGKDWLQVGYALQIGRNAAFRAAGTNAPFGKVYTRFMSEWLRANQFDDIGQQVRYRPLQCIENIIAIEKWRGTLDEPRRLGFNHPDSVWHHWQRMPLHQPKAATMNGTSKAVGGGYHSPVNFDQEMICESAPNLDGGSNATPIHRSADGAS